MKTFKRSLAKLQAILFAGLMLMPVHVPVGAAAFVATTMLTATEAEARAGYRLCMNTQRRRFYVIEKNVSCRISGYAKWSCPMADTYLGLPRGKTCGRSIGNTDANNSPASDEKARTRLFQFSKPIQIGNRRIPARVTPLWIIKAYEN